MDEASTYSSGVKTLLGDPKRAIRKLSLPMMVAMLVQALYNIADGFWVAGLGADELASVGLFFPFFMAITALGAGIGMGGSAAISRRIGEKNKAQADNTAVHTIIIIIIIAVLFSLPFLPFLKKMFYHLSGNEEISAMAAQYGGILFSGSIIILFSNVANAILRGEGDAKRAMLAIMLGSGLNIVLDPLFIYGFKMGVAGAAWATLLSVLISSLLFIYWLWIKKTTYLTLTFKNFRFNRRILGEIFSVGIPSALAQLSMSIAMVVLNKVVILVDSTDGVAVFTSGWRIVMLGSIPLQGMAMGVTSVTGATFGAKSKEKLKAAFLYAIKMGVLTELLVAVFVFLMAGPIAYIFSYSADATRIRPELIRFLRTTALLYPTIPFGMLTSSMFRGIRRGTNSLIVTLLRVIILQVPVAYLLGVVLDLKLVGVWYGIILGNLLAVTFAFIWGLNVLKNLEFKQDV